MKGFKYALSMAKVPLLVLLAQMALSAFVPEHGTGAPADGEEGSSALFPGIIEDKSHGFSIITDLKLDDNLLIQSIVRQRPSVPVNIFVSGIKNQEAGAANTVSFLKQSLGEDAAENIRFILATEPPKEGVSHELNFPDEYPAVKTYQFEDYLKEIQQTPSNQRTLLIQSGQIKADNAYSLIEAYGDRASAYLLIAMFNAEQRSKPETQLFLNTLQSKLNPGVKIESGVETKGLKPLLYSDNWATFSSKTVGSTIQFEQLLPYVPKDHVIQAAKDPYHWKNVFKSVYRVKVHYKYNQGQALSEDEAWMKKMSEALYKLALLDDLEYWKTPRSESKVLPQVSELLAGIAREEKDGGELPRSQVIIKLASKINSLYGNKQFPELEEEWGLQPSQALLDETEFRNKLVGNPEEFKQKSREEFEKMTRKEFKDPAQFEAHFTEEAIAEFEAKYPHVAFQKAQAAKFEKEAKVDVLRLLEDKGQVYKELILSARIANGEIGKALQDELFSYLQLLPKHPSNKAIGEIMERSLIPGFKAFALEACDGIHGAVWFSKIFQDNRVSYNLHQMVNEKVPKIVPAHFVVNKFGFPAAEITTREEATAFLLSDKTDTSKPQETFFESLQGLKKQEGGIGLDVMDPFHVANVKLASFEIHSSALVKRPREPLLPIEEISTERATAFDAEEKTAKESKLVTDEDAATRIAKAPRISKLGFHHI